MSNSIKHKDHRRTVGEWLSEPYEWRIPVYQRHYAWDPEEEFGPTQLFWEIVEEQASKRLKNKKVDPHYFGAILVENKTGNLQSTHNYDVVDGQQRLTTINVAMFAIIGIASQFSYRKDVQDKLEKYIFNDPSPNARKQQKLVPTNFDRTQFGNLLSGAFDESCSYKDDSEQAKRSKVVQACHFFSEEFKEFVDNNSTTDQMVAINVLIDTIIDGFELVLIPLKETDEAQKVFESLNNTARPLTTFDLIRNNIFYRADKALPGSDVELFESREWQQFEDTFWETTPGRSDNNTHVEAYIARMLMAKKQRFLLLNRNAIFKEYKSFAKGEAEKGLNVRAEIGTISEYVDIYKHLVGETKKNLLSKDFDFGYFMHAICNSMDFYPAIFTIVSCDASVEEKKRMIFLLESYVIRRHMCQWPSGDYNKQAPRICKELGSEPNYQKLDEFLKGSPGSETRAFPSNEDILNSCLHHNFYSRNKLKNYIFQRIAHHTTTDRDEVRGIEGLTIDHIMPKAWREKAGWSDALISDALISDALKGILEEDIDIKIHEEDIDIKIHTIGNLTPMSRGLNSAKSNRGWDDPKGARSHLRECDLKMTRILASKDKWDLNDIDERSRELARSICEIWPYDII